MSILHHRRHVKRRHLEREATGRRSCPCEFPRASARDLAASAAEPAAPPVAAAQRRKRKAKAKAKRTARA